MAFFDFSLGDIIDTGTRLFTSKEQTDAKRESDAANLALYDKILNTPIQDPFMKSQAGTTTYPGYDVPAAIQTAGLEGQRNLDLAQQFGQYVNRDRPQPTLDDFRNWRTADETRLMAERDDAFKDILAANQRTYGGAGPSTSLEQANLKSASDFARTLPVGKEKGALSDYRADQAAQAQNLGSWATGFKGASSPELKAPGFKDSSPSNVNLQLAAQSQLGKSTPTPDLAFPGALNYLVTGAQKKADLQSEKEERRYLLDRLLGNA